MGTHKTSLQVGNEGLPPSPSWMVSLVPSPTLCGGLTAAPSEATNEKAHREWLRHSPGTTDLFSVLLSDGKDTDGTRGQSEVQSIVSNIHTMCSLRWQGQWRGQQAHLKCRSVPDTVIPELESKANGAVHEIAPSGKRTVGYGEKGQKRGPMGVCSNRPHFTPLMMLCARVDS